MVPTTVLVGTLLLEVATGLFNLEGEDVQMDVRIVLGGEDTLPNLVESCLLGEVVASFDGQQGPFQPELGFVSDNLAGASFLSSRLVLRAVSTLGELAVQTWCDETCVDDDFYLALEAESEAESMDPLASALGDPVVELPVVRAAVPTPKRELRRQESDAKVGRATVSGLSGQMSELVGLLTKQNMRLEALEGKEVAARGAATPIPSLFPNVAPTSKGSMPAAPPPRAGSPSLLTGGRVPLGNAR